MFERRTEPARIEDALQQLVVAAVAGDGEVARCHAVHVV
jgi:hypothetical protein